MPAPANGPRYLMRWNFRRDQTIDRQWMRTAHRLTELPSFSDAGLADLINRYPASAIAVETAANNPSHPSERQTGDLGRLSGHEVVSLLSRESFSVVLKDLHDHSPVVGIIANRLAGEMMECSHNLRIRAYAADLHLSSAATATYLRSDARPSVHWGIRGEQTIIRYTESVSTNRSQMIKRAIESDWDAAYRKPLYHEPAMDQTSERELLGAGTLVSVPQHAPHRIVQGDTFGVSLVMRFETDDSRTHNEIMVANDWLATRFGREVSDATHGWKATAKRFIATRIAASHQRHSHVTEGGFLFTRSFCCESKSGPSFS